MAHYDRYLELLAQHNATGRAEDALQPLPCWDRSVARASAPKVLRYLRAWRRGAAFGHPARRRASLSVGRRRALAAAGAAAFRARAGDRTQAAPVVAALRRRCPWRSSRGAGAGAAAGRAHASARRGRRALAAGRDARASQIS